MTRRLLVITEYIRPPIPTHHMDWQAVTDDYDGPGSPMGYGPTEAAAVADLYHQINDREDMEADRTLQTLIDREATAITNLILRVDAIAQSVKPDGSKP
jgi:hypothetical protein